MNVKELKEMLEKIPDETPVIISSDPEGNSYGKLEGFGEARVYQQDLDRYFIDSIYGEEDEVDPSEWDKMIPVIVFWP
jgi:hypothetical protein